MGLPKPGVSDLQNAFLEFDAQLAGGEAGFDKANAPVAEPRDQQPLPEVVREWVYARSRDAELAEELASALIRARGRKDWTELEELEERLQELGEADTGSGGVSVTPVSALVASREWETAWERRASLAYLDDAVRQVGVDLAWTLAAEGRFEEADAVRQVFRARSERATGQQDAQRSLFWMEAEDELTRWVDKARRVGPATRAGGGVGVFQPLKRLFRR